MEKITRISIKSNIELRKQSPNKSSISDKNYGKQKNRLYKCGKYGRRHRENRSEKIRIYKERKKKRNFISYVSHELPANFPREMQSHSKNTQIMLDPPSSLSPLRYRANHDLPAIGTLRLEKLPH